MHCTRFSLIGLGMLGLLGVCGCPSSSSTGDTGTDAGSNAGAGGSGGPIVDAGVHDAATGTGGQHAADARVDSAVDAAVAQDAGLHPTGSGGNSGSNMHDAAVEDAA